MNEDAMVAVFTARIRDLGDIPKKTHKDVIQAIKEAYNKGIKDGSRKYDDNGILRDIDNNYITRDDLK